MECLKLDWLGFTFRPSYLNDYQLPIDRFQEVFNFFPWENLLNVSFRSHYSDTYFLNDIVIAYNYFDMNDDRFDVNKRAHLISMGVNVQVPSHVLPYFFNLCGIDFNSDTALKEMLSFLSARDCKISRIDLCYDDFNYKDSFTAKDYCQWHTLGAIESPFIRTLQSIGSDLNGWTFYAGSLKRRTKLLRIYDKYKESNGEIDSVRYEFELHTDEARCFCDKFLNDDITLSFKDFLFSWIKIKDLDSVKNCSRIQDAKFNEKWLSWVNAKSQFNAKVVRLSHISKSSVGSNVEWLRTRVIPSLAGFSLIFGKTTIFDLIQQCIDSDNISPLYKSTMNRLKHCSEMYDSDLENMLDNPFLNT